MIYVSPINKLTLYTFSANFNSFDIGGL